MAESLSQYGITWTFADAVVYGQFVNGDYWVVGPITIIQIDPVSADLDGRIRHGSMLNPTYGNTQGFDNAMARHAYSAANNVARPNGAELSARNPLVITTGSLVSAITHVEPGRRPQLTDAAILTVLPRPPPNGSFRPPWSGRKKMLHWNIADIRWDVRDANRVPATSGVTRHMRSMPVMERWVERPWFEYSGGVWTHRYMTPSNNRPDYGREVANQLGEIGLALLLDLPREAIETLMIRYLQVGIDLYGITATASPLFNTSSQGHFWQGGGGIAIGRKWPMLFAGLMFNDAGILAYCNAGGYRPRWDAPRWEAEPGYPIFQEEQQHFLISQKDVDQSRYDRDSRPREPYTADMIGIPEWGESHVNSPQRDGSNWGAYYRDIVSSALMGHVLAAMLFTHTAEADVTARQMWNWEPIFDYMDRYVQDRSHAFKGGTNDPRPFYVDMWNAYRGRCGPQWGSDAQAQTAEVVSAPSQPPPVRRPVVSEPAPAAAERYRALLRERLVQATASRHPPRFRYSAINQEVEVIAVDEHRVRLRVPGMDGAQVSIDLFASLSMGDALNMATAIRRSGDKHDHALVAFYLLANNKIGAARIALQQAGEHAEEVLAAFSNAQELME